MGQGGGDLCGGQHDGRVAEIVQTYEEEKHI